MAKRILKSKGRTAEEAINHGLRKIHLPRESVEVRLLREGRKILGLIPWDAIVYLIYDPLSAEVSPKQEINSSVEEALEQIEGPDESEKDEEEVDQVKQTDEPVVNAETDSTEQEQVGCLSEDNTEPPTAETGDKL